MYFSSFFLTPTNPFKNLSKNILKKLFSTLSPGNDVRSKLVENNQKINNAEEILLFVLSHYRSGNNDSL